MRWNVKIKPKSGDKIIKRGFLFFPKCIDNEWRWLEMATWEIEYYVGAVWHSEVNDVLPELCERDSRWIKDTK